jgi:orotidine-5'-phosphate decarboxylase
MGSMQARDRLIVAVDLSDRDAILSLISDLRGVGGVFKIGLQAFIANGPSLVRDIVEEGERVFLDLKIHDIPNTARSAVAEAVGHGASMVTVHASGGESMLRGCAAAQDSAIVLGVTVLTSLDDDELSRIGFQGSALESAVRLAALSRDSGLRGVVASPHEIGAIRAACGTDLVIVTPGIRPAGEARDDQRRTMTPLDAIREGADYIVVGRPIVAAPNPRDAAMRLLDEIALA